MEKKLSLLSLITTSNLVFFVIFFLLIDLQRNSFVSTTAIDTGIPLIDIRSNETSSVDIINLTSGGSGDHSKGVLPKVYEDGNSIFSLGTYEFGELGINNLMDNTPLVPYLLDNSFFEKIRVKDIVLNNLQTTFLSDSGDVYSIGKNKFGQFGDGTTSESFNYNPTLLQLNEKVIKVVLGTSHMLLLTITGVVYGVGDNSGNQLIPNGAANYLLPVKIFDTSYSIKDIQAGEQFSLGISNTGSIYSLGKNVIISTYTGRVPAPQPTLIPTPPIPIPSAPTPLPTSPIVPIASTIPTVTAYTITNIDIDYEDRYNSLNFDIPEPTPVTSFAPILVVEGKKPIRIWTGKLCVLVETDTQEFFLNGQLGEFKSTERFVSISIISGIVNWKNFTDVRFSQNSILLLTDSLVVYEVIYGDSFSLYERVGNVKVFGELKVIKTTDGQNVYEKDVSSGLYTKKLSLKNLKPNAEITKIVMASKFDGLSLTYYLTSDNSIYFSIKHPNDNNNARATSFGFSPMNITYNINGLLPSTLRFIKPSKGNTFSIFVDNSNNIYSSGSIDGSVGLTMAQILSTELPAGDMITDISVGESHTLILTTKQLVFAFGNNDNTQFCTATGAGDPKTTLTKVGLSNVIAIAAGNGFSLFVISAPESTTGTQVYVCGNSGLKENTGGFLDFFDGKNITSIVGANQHSFFLSSSGSVYAVGTNTKNVLGIEGVEADSTTTIPTEVGLKGEKIVKVSSVYETALFLTEKGEVYASGAISNETLSSIPRKIMNGLEGKVIVDIGVGLDFALLLTSNGELYGIRYNTINYYGQLGAGLDPMSFIPIRIPIYNKVKNMEVGYSHSFLTISNAEPLCDKIANCSGHGICTGPNICSCIDGWQGEDCSQYSCVNCTNGTCVGPNQCKCNDGWTGMNCTEYSCKNVSDCNGNGTCISPNVCLCKDGYKGNAYCNATSCEKVGGCSNHGSCIGPNQCLCETGWNGNANCSQVSTIFNCDKVNNCSNHGTCISTNQCWCNDGWTGMNCTEYSCQNVTNCSNHGSCVGPNTCNCFGNWTGSNCSIPMCFGIPANETTTCNGKGYCKEPNNCQCFGNWTGNNCSIPTCFGIPANETITCNGNGTCIESNKCQCFSGYGGPQCTQFNCSEVNYCNNGNCVGPNTCSCFDGWSGKNCSIPKCFGIPANETTTVCGGNGYCVGLNSCKCKSGWEGLNCTIFNCFNLNNCSNHGSCIGPNQCNCSSEWNKTLDCSEMSQPPVIVNCDMLNNCSGHGLCIGLNQCQCQDGWKTLNNCGAYECLNLNNCSNHGSCVGPNQCECFSGWKGSTSCNNTSCELLNNCYNNGNCIGPNQCKCNEGYDSYDCKFSKLLDTDMDISGKIEGIEKITKFSLVVIVNNTKVDPSNIYYNYFIVNIMNITSINPKIEFTMKNKGNYELFITIYSKERTDYIFGKLKRNIIVSEFKENTITTLNLNDIYEITQNNNDLYNNENKTSIVQQVISSIKKEIIQTSDQGEKVLEIYKSVATHAEIPVSVNITSQINQISNIMLESKKNSSITDSQVDVTINNIVFILDNILQQTNSSLNTTDAPTSVLRKDTESTIQTSLSLLSISSSILQKRVEGKTMNLLFKRIENNNNVTKLNFANEYQFNVPNDVNNNAKDNISYGVVKINSDSQLYSTSEMKLSNILQLKTFINGSYVPLKNLIQPIRISFKLEKKNVSFNNSVNYSCKYFNESSQEWKSDGCQNVGTTIYTDYIVMNCECDHTTSFLTFLEFSNPIKSNNQTSIAQIVLSSIYLVIIIVIFIGLLIFTKLNEPIIKSRFLTPYLGLTAIFIDNLFSGIISNSIFQQTKLFPTTNSPTYDSAADIVGNVAIIISTMMTLIAISNYCIECIRYLLIRYLYELLNNNDLNVEKGYLFKIFTSKLIYIITNIVIGISIIIYFVIFVILRRFNVISSYTFSCVTSITYFLLILLFSIIILTIYIIDIYFTKKYKQFSNEMIDIIKNTEPSSQEKNPKDEKKKINLTVKNYQHFIYNFFITNDTLQFRLEACIYFLGLTFFIISFSIGFYLLSLKESTASKVEQPSTAILIFDLIRTITWIMLFGGYILIILISKKILNNVNKNATKKIDEENNEFNFSFIFKRKEIFTLFKQFSKQEFSLENVYAFIDLEKMKEEAKQNNSMIWNEFEKFKTKYLDNYATMELNISFEVKRQVNEYLKERNNVNDLIQCIENALYINLGDTYSRFIETSEYLFIENCNELQEKLKN